jgi:hypothetical protein
MKTALIGYSGFVGKNLLGQFHFSHVYNSKNIEEIRNQAFDRVVCAGIPSEMWLANQNPEKDMAAIQTLLNAVATIDTPEFVLISSIAVYRHPVEGYDEGSMAFEEKLAYGRNRREAEKMIADRFKTPTIIRLPALFGDHLKKNFIYDLMNQEPAFLTEAALEDIFTRLNGDERNLLQHYYDFNEKKNMFAFNRELAVERNARQRILDVMKSAGFTSLKFTHSESKFQFYPLTHLQRDIEIALEHDIDVLNLCSPPVKAAEIAGKFYEIDFSNDNGKPPLQYDMRTRYAGYWGKDAPYQYSKHDVLSELKRFFDRHRNG